MPTVENLQLRYSNPAANELIATTADMAVSQIPFEQKKLSFVVNIPLPASTEAIATMKSVLAAYQPIEKEITPPFAIVFCVNAKQPKQPKQLKKSAKNLDEPETAAAIEEFVKAIKDSEEMRALAESEIPIRIISGEWTGDKFPYGTVRNALMHSKSTKVFVDAYQKQGYYPYIAVADADDGKRFTDEGVHIFQAIEERLRISNHFEAEMGIVDDEASILTTAMDVAENSESAEAWLEFMQTQNTEIWQSFLAHTSLTEKNSAEAYQAAWFEYLAQQNQAEQALFPTYAHPYLIAGGYRTKSIDLDIEESEQYAQAQRRAEIIEEDMNTRMLLSKVNPLGPYFPEPNLYIDASIAQQVNFGPGGAESDHLKIEVEEVIKKDVVDKAERVYQPTSDIKIVPDPTPLTKNEIEQNRLALMTNNRDPERHYLVVPMFDLTIETDTDRLFKKVNKAKEPEKKLFEANVYNSVAQHHRSTNAAKTTYLGSRYKGDIHAKGANFVKVRDDLQSLEESAPLDLFTQVIKKDIDLLKENARIETRKSAQRAGRGKRKAPSFIDDSHLFVDVFKTALAAQSSEFQQKFAAGKDSYMAKVLELRDILALEQEEKLATLLEQEEARYLEQVNFLDPVMNQEEIEALRHEHEKNLLNITVPSLTPEELTTRIFAMLEEEILSGEALDNPNKKTKLKETSEDDDYSRDSSESFAKASANTKLETPAKEKAQSIESAKHTGVDFFKRQTQTLAKLATKDDDGHKVAFSKRRKHQVNMEQDLEHSQSTSINNFKFTPIGKKE